MNSTQRAAITLRDTARALVRFAPFTNGYTDIVEQNVRAGWSVDRIELEVRIQRRDLAAFPNPLSETRALEAKGRIEALLDLLQAMGLPEPADTP